MSKKVEFSLEATLKGHTGWVTQVAGFQDKIISSSRDNSIIIWDLKQKDNIFPLRRLTGHSHFVSDVVLSQDGKYALSSSWDKTLRLWDLNIGKSVRRFEGHTDDVLTVAFSQDNRQILSGSRDKTLRLWNTLAHNKYIFSAHDDWVSCVRFLPNYHSKPVFVSAGWDKCVKTWYLPKFSNVAKYTGHTGYLNCVTVSPDGSLCASGGKDHKLMLWDLNENKNLYTWDHKDIINAMSFCPSQYWLSVASGSTISIWDLQSKEILTELKPEVVCPNKEKFADCVSLTWYYNVTNQDENELYLYTGHTDNVIRVWKVKNE